MSAELSGRVLDLEKQVLALPDYSDWQALQVTSSSRFNTVEGNVADLYVKFNELNNKIVNLQLYGNTGFTGNHQHIGSEVPAGAIDGSNRVFTLNSTPYPSASLALYKNGLLQRIGAGNDYTLSVNTITFELGAEPPTGSNLLAYYQIS